MSAPIILSWCPKDGTGEADPNDICFPCKPQPIDTGPGGAAWSPPQGCGVDEVNIVEYQIIYSVPKSNPNCPEYTMYEIGSAQIWESGQETIAFGIPFTLYDYGANSLYVSQSTWIGFVDIAHVVCPGGSIYGEVIMDTTGVPTAGIYGWWTHPCNPIPADAGAYDPGTGPPADAVLAGQGAPDATAGANAAIAFANEILGN